MQILATAWLMICLTGIIRIWEVKVPITTQLRCIDSGKPPSHAVQTWNGAPVMRGMEAQGIEDDPGKSHLREVGSGKGGRSLEKIWLHGSLECSGIDSHGC